jgi:hypothetical protein
MLGDIAVLTGGKAIFKDLGIELESVQLADLGRPSKVTITSEETTVVEGAGTSEEIKGRTEMIRREITGTDSEYDREKLQGSAWPKLAGGVAQLNVGAATETEMKERKALVEDALHATRAAIEEGIVPGGGTALIRATAALSQPEAHRRRGAGRVRSSASPWTAGPLHRRERRPRRRRRRQQDPPLHGPQLRLQRRVRHLGRHARPGHRRPQPRSPAPALQKAASVAGPCS